MEYIHIAGTNAKGSTAQYLAEILQKNHKTGLYTSPHILSPRERFQIGGEAISEADYRAYMEAARGETEEHFFCVWTRAALAWFADNDLEYAVVETGLGGRCDPTNVIPAQMQILTPISFDHMQQLGNTLTKIAREKCGIIKYGSTVVSHPQPEEAMDVIRKTCARTGSYMVVLDEHKIRMRESGVLGQAFDFRYRDLYLKDVKIRAVSPMQADNACVAAMAAYELGLSPKEIKEGLEKTAIPARVECRGNLLIDASHNPAAVRELRQTVRKYFGKKNVTVLCAVMADKDVAAIAEEIKGFADQVVLTCADKKRGLSAKELARHFTCGKPVEDPAYAYEYAAATAAQKKGILVVCGSFYLVPYVMQAACSGEA